MTDQPTAPRPRYAIVDIARGVAIIAMVVYHFFWDLSYFRFIAADVGYDLNWVIFARTILAAFMFLVGVGLVLGHGAGIRWHAFLRRWVWVLAGALAITLVTRFAFPDSFVFFGVLHAIAVTSLLGLAFLRTPIWLNAILAIVIIALGIAVKNPFFNEWTWSWIGLWEIPPPTNDLVPLIPWFGVVLLGMVATRLVLASSLAAKLAAIQPTGRLPKSLSFLGRWSLLIYVLHQPILLGLVAPAAQIFQLQIAMREPDFLRSCQSTCEDGGTPANMCVTYCQCGLEGVEKNDLWNAINTGIVSAAEQSLLDAQNMQCSALIYPSLTAPE
jgi:uncharacterized membrane protein